MRSTEIAKESGEHEARLLWLHALTIHVSVAHRDYAIRVRIARGMGLHLDGRPGTVWISVSALHSFLYLY